MQSYSDTALGSSVNSKEPKPFNMIFIILGWIGTILSLLAGVAILYEWIRIGIIANPEEIKKYYFGSEAMIAHGGWMYKSASIYAWSAFAEGIIIFVVMANFIISLIKKLRWGIYLGYSFWIIFCIWLYVPLILI
jgi:hypothetical protein